MAFAPATLARAGAVLVALGFAAAAGLAAGAAEVALADDGAVEALADGAVVVRFAVEVREVAFAGVAFAFAGVALTPVALAAALRAASLVSPTCAVESVPVATDEALESLESVPADESLESEPADESLESEPADEPLESVPVAVDEPFGDAPVESVLLVAPDAAAPGRFNAFLTGSTPPLGPSSTISGSGPSAAVADCFALAGRRESPVLMLMGPRHGQVIG